MTIVKNPLANKNKRPFRICWTHLEGNRLSPEVCIFQNVAIREGT